MIRGARTLKTRERIAITVNDCAFLRAVVQGMDVVEAGRRYIADYSDLRELRSRLRMLIDALRNQIDQHKNKNEKDLRTAALISLQQSLFKKPGPQKSSKSAEPPKVLPAVPISFEAYNARENPDGMYYREAEIAEMYERDVLAPWRIECAKLGGAAHASTNAETDKPVLTSSQMTALLDSIRGLETTAAVEPTLQDNLSIWIHNEALLRRLKKRGVKTVGHLYEQISKHGARWHEKFVGVGEKKARQVATWLSKASPSLQIEVPATAIVPRSEARALSALNGRQRSLGIVPFEYMLVDYERRGHDGLLRSSEQRTIKANDDYQAIEEYLSRFKSTTQRAYRIEIERFYLWCLYQRGIPLSSAQAEDCQLYRKFLLDPQPKERWIQSKRVSRTSGDWRPFMHPMKDDAAERSITILSAFFSWLRDANYLTANAFAALRASPVADSKQDKQTLKESLRHKLRDQRVMQIDVWSLVEGYLLSLDVSDAMNARKVAVLRLMQGTGVRAEEALLAQVGDLQKKVNRQTGETYYKLFVRGKGDKLRGMVVPDEAIQALDQHFQHRGLGSIADGIPAENHDETYLIGQVRLSRKSSTEKRRSGISYHTLYMTVVDVFEKTIAAAENDPNLSKDAKRKLKKASPHWLRHCFASISLNHGMSVPRLAKLLGHADLATTSLYAKDEDEALELEQIESFARARARVAEMNRTREP